MFNAERSRRAIVGVVASAAIASAAFLHDDNAIPDVDAKKKKKKKKRPTATPEPTNTPSPTPAPTWRNVSTFGSFGQENWQFKQVRDIALTSDGCVAFITDPDLRRLSIWRRSADSETDWMHVTNIGEQRFGQLGACALAPDDLTLLVVDPGMEHISVWSRPSTSSDDWTYVTAFGSSGANAEQFSNPWGVAVTSDGLTACVTDYQNKRVSIWGRNNTGSSQWANVTTIESPSSMMTIRDLALSADDKWMFVADQHSDCVLVLNRPNTSGHAWSLQTPFGSSGNGVDQFANPQGIAISSDGLTAYVTNEQNSSCVSVWMRSSASSNDWAFVTKFGTIGSGPGRLLFPQGIALYNNQVFVADLGNARVSVWQYP